LSATRIGVVRQGRFQPLSRFTEMESLGLASAADTEVTMLSERAATHAANHFEAVRLFMGGLSICGCVRLSACIYSGHAERLRATERRRVKMHCKIVQK
jgi:hypothetical protein